MKKIFKLLFLSIFIITFTSCDNEDMELLTISAQGSGQITAPESGYSQILNPEEDFTNTAFTLVWNAADYGIPTGINYKIEFAKEGTDFAEPIVAGSTSNTVYSWNITEFNGAVTSLGLAPFVEGGVDIRVVSTVGSLDSTPQTTDMITVYVTPFTTDLPTISVPGNHQGWDPATAPLLASSGFGETNYEGYVWLDGEFKFTGPNDLGNFDWTYNWGDDGSFSGILLANSDTNCTAEVGYYIVKADTEALTYSTTPISWGVLGDATPTGWDSDTDMVYDADTKTLKVTLDLIKQDAPDHGIKFRADDVWTLNYGDTGADGSLDEGGDNIGVPESGNYTITLDLSNPRDYTYSLVKN